MDSKTIKTGIAIDAAKSRKRERARLRMQARRQDPDVRKKEAEAKKQKRLNSKVWKADAEASKLIMRRKRQNSVARKADAEASKLIMRRKRQNPDARKADAEASKLIMRRKRQNSVARKADAEASKLIMRRKRQNSVVRKANAEASKLIMRRKRQNPEVRKAEAQAKKLKRDEWSKVVVKYNKTIRDGPVHRCHCCDRLWFRKSITPVTKASILSKGASEDFIQKVFSVNPEAASGQFCRTCVESIRKFSVPMIAISNGFKFPEIPPSLEDLTLLEERLVSARIPFMQIKPLGRDRQFGVKGSIVNVPVEVDNMVGSLPRNLDENYTVEVQLKKRMMHKSNYMYEKVNPKKIFDAAMYLTSQPLYQDANIELDLNWMIKFEEDLSKRNENDEEQDSSEDEEDELNPGSGQTMIYSDRGITLAPGENKVPMSVLFDNKAEELSFPTIFCGKPRNITSPVTYTKIANSEIRRYDRRAVRPDHLLYVFSKTLRFNVVNATALSLRKKRRGENPVTAEQVLDPNIVKKLIQHDDGYTFLKGIKSSPAHWENEKKKVFAAIRQFGLPTFFVTLSAAETHWPNLINMLSVTVDKKELSEEDYTKLTYGDKCRLIQQDPVTCALYFQHKFESIMETWKCSSGPFGGNNKIEHFFYRIEFQHRGSPHVHMILWLKESPRFDPNSHDHTDLETYIDSMVSCSKYNEYVRTYQTHKHTFSCKRTDKHNVEYCRFNIPFFPMSRTRIIIPFAKDDPIREAHEPHFVRIKNYLNDKDYDPTLTLSQFLDVLQLTPNGYINAIKAGLKKPQICLKRRPDEVMINNYHPDILNLHQANMDIQFVLDGYACVQYMIDYINKSNRGMSKLLKKVVDIIRANPTTHRNCLREVANAFLNASEISAQEAAWSILYLPMSMCSENTIFIPTFSPSERTRVVKSEFKLRKLKKESVDIFEASIIDTYVARPDELEDLCLADFAAWYEKVKLGLVELKMELGFMRKRTRPKIIRYVNFRQSQDELNFYREQITLYIPWRNEVKEVLNIDCKLAYLLQNELITANKKKYVFNMNFDMDQALDDLQRERDDELQKLETPTTTVMKFYDELDEGDELKSDIQVDCNAAVSKGFDTFRVSHRLPDTDYRELLRTANVEQRDYLMHVKSVIATKKGPFYHFVSGPAGSGKSRLIAMLHEVMVREHDERGQNPELETVLKVAPTGKAAHGIKGVTIHSAFSIPVTQCTHVIELNPSLSNRLACKYHHVKCLIIDEISMVGYKLLNQMNSRLKQIKGSDECFGGVSVLCFGDFRQLKPVGDSFVFRVPKSDKIGTLAGPVLWEKFQLYELTEIMRQKDDAPFAHALNRLADGTMTLEDKHLMASRCKPEPLIPNSAVRLYARNVDVDRFNQRKLKGMTTESAEADAWDSVCGIGTVTQKEYYLHEVRKKKHQDTAGLPLHILLRLAAKYILTVNVNVRDGLANGAVGTLKRIDYCPVKGSSIRGVRRVWLEFEDGEIGNLIRTTMRPYIDNHKIPSTWTPIDRIGRSISRSKSNALSVNRLQFPMVVAEAMTIHKAQGATFQEVAVHLDSGMERSHVYVGVSRATQASGLYISGSFKPPSKPEEDDPIVVEINRLRQYRVIPKFRFLREVNETDTQQFIFHNVQSLHAHETDIRADSCYLSCDVLMFAETWTLPTDVFQLHDFHELARVDGGRLTRKPRGVVVFAKEKVRRLFLKCDVFTCGDEITMMTISLRDNRKFIVGYVAPNAQLDKILEALNTVLTGASQYKTILAADFNVNFNSPQGKRLIDVIKALNFEVKSNILHFTTRGNTTIDAIISNHAMETGVYESIFSYHKPLYGRI